MSSGIRDSEHTVAYSGSDLEALLSLKNYQQWIVDTISPGVGGRVLEIGAGIGAFSDHLLARAASLALVEPSPNLSRVLREKYAAEARVTVVGDTLETFLAGGTAAAYDTVVMINVLEHIENDLAALQGLRRMLTDNGRLALFVPAKKFLFSKLDAEFGHFRRYERQPLFDLAVQAGFTVETCKYMDLLGIAPWYVMNVLLGSTGFNPFLVNLYDRIGVPATRAFERLIGSPPVGKNLVLTARCRG